MPTTVVKYIGAGSGHDYTTLQSWDDACPANLVTADQIWQGQIMAPTDGFTATGSTLLTISGNTVDSTHYEELTTAPGASFRDNANAQTNALKYNTPNGCYLKTTATYGGCINNSQNYTRFSNLQMQSNPTSSGGNAAVFQSSMSGVFIDNCIIDYSGIVICRLDNATVRNCLVVNRNSGASAIADIQLGSAINCTFVAPYDIAVKPSYGLKTHYQPTLVENCAVFGASAVSDYTVATTVLTNYTDVSSPPAGFTQAAYSTAQFVGVTNAAGDWRLPSGSALIDHGTTDATNAPYDIAGTFRPQGTAYDVGCWEYVAAGGGFQPAVARGSNNTIGVGIV